jgi:hypothetical protein
VKDVLKSQAEALDPPSKPLVVFGLLEHENKVLKKKHASSMHGFCHYHHLFVKVTSLALSPTFSLIYQ